MLGTIETTLQPNETSTFRLRLFFSSFFFLSLKCFFFFFFNKRKPRERFKRNGEIQKWKLGNKYNGVKGKLLTIVVVRGEINVEIMIIDGKDCVHALMVWIELIEME